MNILETYRDDHKFIF